MMKKSDDGQGVEDAARFGSKIRDAAERRRRNWNNEWKCDCAEREAA